MLKTYNLKLPGVFEAIKPLNDSNYLVIIITNQACIGKSIPQKKT